jgi:glucosamine-6-phosphate deaminase
VYSSADAVAHALARRICRLVAADPAVVFGLSTGRTPVPLYRELVDLYRRGRIDFSRVTTFNLDEFVGVPSGDPRSFHSFMRLHLVDHINLKPRRVHVLNGAAADLARECTHYERAIARAGGIDLQLLGLGANGHIGFNEPARALVAHTHRTRLRPPTRRANAEWFGGRVGSVPEEALSMGMATILHARHIVLMATGSGKAPCVRRMIEGPVTPALPASFLQLHGRVEVWLDRSAASRLSGAP